MSETPRSFSLPVRPLSPGAEALLVGVLLAGAYLFLSLSGVMQVGALNDDGVYTALGKALAEGRGYVSIHLVGQPVQEKYPPGFPFILSLLWRLSGSVEGVRQLVSLLHPVIVGLAAGVLWWVGRARLSASRALLGLFVITPLLFDAAIQYYTIPLSEPWFMLGWAAVLALWEEAGEAAADRRIVWLAAAGAMVAATVLVRTQAIVLVPAVLLGLLARRFSIGERVAAITSMLLPLVTWRFYHAALMAHGPHSGLPDDGAYTTWLGGGSSILGSIVDTVRFNLASYVGQIGPYLSGVAFLGSILGVLLIVAMTLGPLGVVRRQPILGISSLGGLAIVIVWPFAQDRLLLSVLPFTGLALAVWLSPFVRDRSARVGRVLGYATAIAMTLVLFRQADIRRESLTAFSAAVPAGPGLFSPVYVLLVNSRFIAHASSWIRKNTSPEDRVMIDNHSGIYLYTGRTTMPASPSESRLQASVFDRPGHYLAARILRDSLTYVIVAVPNPGILRDIDTVKQRCPGVLSWGGVDSSDSRTILKVHRDEPCLTALGGPE
jgi:Dolichyl-phosphate-mannose-protein mannosyltransferase